MARNTWSMSTSTNNGSTWTSDGTIYRPNEALTLSLAGTQQTLNLADGSLAYLIPETKYHKGDVTFRWLSIAYSDGLRTKIENYVINQNYCKITDHNSNTLIGRFMSVRQVWLTGLEDTYDIEANFLQMA